MSSLIENLKKEHAAILEAMDRMKESGASSAAGKEAAVQVRESLLSHLKREDEFLYPPLQKAAKDDPSLRIKLNMMAEDMQKITKAARDFFTRYHNGGEGLEFIKDFGSLAGKLNIRINWEESQLYPEYDRRFSSKPGGGR